MAFMSKFGISSILSFDVSPETKVIDDFETPSDFERYLINSAFALPSIGGAESLIFTAFAYSPASSVLRAFGIILNFMRPIYISTDSPSYAICVFSGIFFDHVS